MSEWPGSGALVLNKLIRLAMLYDFYGPLLTERQQRFLELYYHHDWSLSEIAAQHGITRQAVHDLLRRVEASLESYETRLALLERFWEQRSVVEGLREWFDHFESLCREPRPDGIPPTMAELRVCLREGRQLLNSLDRDTEE
ncbi:MAG: YlxM family DNA-binding protein [Thermaerobacterales bacterium]